MGNTSSGERQAQTTPEANVLSLPREASSRGSRAHQRGWGGRVHGCAHIRVAGCRGSVRPPHPFLSLESGFSIVWASLKLSKWLRLTLHFHSPCLCLPDAPETLYRRAWFTWHRRPNSGLLHAEQALHHQSDILSPAVCLSVCPLIHSLFPVSATSWNRECSLIAVLG